MSDKHNNDEGSLLPFQRTQPAFRGFPEFRSNVLYCPKQFFSVVLPHSSVNCIRLVAYMLRKTLGWVDDSGEPLQEQHQFTYRELEASAGIVHSGLRKAINEALTSRFIACVQQARVQTRGVRAQSATYELRWDEDQYTDELEEFHGFYLPQGYIDREGQNRIGRKNIPNVFFDYLIRNENRGVIRVVGTLLWYSIDWGKGGERRQPIRKSLRDLVELTQLDKSSVVRALDEAEQREYVERLERGVFDLSGRRQSSTTLYGIHWTNEYVYTHEGLPIEVTQPSERSKNATHSIEANAPKTQHEEKRRTLQKRNTEESLERSKNATPNAPKTRHAERSKNATKETTKTKIVNTSISNSSSPTLPAVAVDMVEQLVFQGFSKRDAALLAGKVPEAVILRQIELLPYRNAFKNKLGLLRKAIEENWPAPDGFERTTDVCSSAGKEFASHFYAGYHGNSEAPVSEPSPGDSTAADAFVQRLLAIQWDLSLVPTWGRQFGALVAYRHGEKRHAFPALQPAIRQFGDEFFIRLKTSVEAERQVRLREARAAHVTRFRTAYEHYLREAFQRHQTEQTLLFEEFVFQEKQSLTSMRANRVDLTTESLGRQYPSDEGRLERFERFLPLSETAHDVLDFWGWDQTLNAEQFIEEKL